MRIDQHEHIYAVQLKDHTEYSDLPTSSEHALLYIENGAVKTKDASGNVSAVGGSNSPIGQPTILRTTSNQSWAHAVIAEVDFDESETDPNGWFNPSNPERITVDADGVYFFGFFLKWAAKPITGDFPLLMINGTSFGYGINNSHVTGKWRSAGMTAYLANGDIVTVRARQSTGGTISLLAGARLIVARWII